METKNSIKPTKLRLKFKLALAGAGIMFLFLSCFFAWQSFFFEKMWTWFFGKEIANEMANYNVAIIFTLCYGGWVSIAFFLIAFTLFAYAVCGEE